MSKEKINRRLAILVITTMIVATFGECIEGEEETPSPTHKPEMLK